MSAASNGPPLERSQPCHRRPAALGTDHAINANSSSLQLYGTNVSRAHIHGNGCNNVNSSSHTSSIEQA